jgi:polyribonucleotide nucleotidyltransferase
MASVCATSMALMDAGVPIKEAVCGVAMGIVVKYENPTPIFTTSKDEYNNGNTNICDYKILTDISGMEDYFGDMDFKVSGTKHGITAIQADFKIAGLPFKIVKEVIEKSKPARQKILAIMNSAINKPRKAKKANHPVLKSLEFDVGQRGKLLGVGGMNLKKIYSKTGVTINLVDEKTLSIFAPNETVLAEAEEIIRSLMNEPKEPSLEFGGIYKAKIVSVIPAGLMVELYANMKPALLPNSQLDGRKIMHGSVTDYKEGQEIQIKYFGRDPVDGNMR